MFRIITIVSILSLVLFAIGCGGGAGKVANAPNTNINAVTSSTVDPANMPAGISANEIRQPVNAPGIPANGGQLPKGATPTPGIPSPAELKKPFKPGATPTPGIPDQETIRKALGQRSTNVNTSPPTGNNPPMMKNNPPTMMKSNKVTGGKIQ